MHKEYTRIFTTRCPDCLKELRGELLKEGDNVFLYRNCESHGVYKLLLSINGNYYTDLDNFYFNILKKNKPKGKITTVWLHNHNKCNMNCIYCVFYLENPIFNNINNNDITDILKKNKNTKIAITGGEPTLSKDIEFIFKEGKRLKCHTQIATNGLLIADYDFCKKLFESGMQEVRLSTETFHEINTTKLNCNNFINKKLKALENLEKLNIKTVLSPTIFKGINENHIFECIEYARNRSFIAEISINGFTWNGTGTNLSREYTLMPDEIVDIICKKYIIEERKDIFLFTKLTHIILQFFNIRLCMNTQILIFYRKKGEITSLTNFINFKILEKLLTFFEKHLHKMGHIGLAVFIFTSLLSIKVKAVYLLPSIIKMLFANLVYINTHKYPNQLLPVVINTTCSTLTADSDNIKQCMSGVIMNINNEIIYKKTPEIVFFQESSNKNKN